MTAWRMSTTNWPVPSREGMRVRHRQQVPPHTHLEIRLDSGWVRSNISTAIARYRMMWCDMIWLNEMRYGTMRYEKEWYGVIQSHMRSDCVASAECFSYDVTATSSRLFHSGLIAFNKNIPRNICRRKQDTQYSPHAAVPAFLCAKSCWMPFAYWGLGNSPGVAVAKRAISSSVTKVGKSIWGKLFTRKALTSSKVFNFQMSCSGTHMMFAVLGASPLTDSSPKLIRVFVVCPTLLEW